MSVEHERLKAVLADAATKDTPEARAAYLDAACQGDAGLRRQVEALLSAHERAGDFLEQSVLPPVEEQPIGEGPGTVIGRYKLLEEIGKGGFGLVFMAEQQQPVHRKVALKIIKAGMDTREVIARFEAERQALALMDHPNIAKVLDAGTTETGRPYFVMELVRGIPITEYCDQQQLPTAERLQLFMKVCAAVQHAHQKGIIHRDLKPTNILVTVIDGEPVSKIIDFGVAKALGQKLTEKTIFTAFQQMIGTPAYMSPEQAALSGVDVDTRSDIYSLGVLLYELLTGQTPFDPKTLAAAGVEEMRRIIRETEPPRPSTRLATALATTPRSALRSPQLQEVRGDLDWIAMKCLEKDRARRYEAANNLAEDIERHLKHQPVIAAAPGAFYRMEKFVRRHRFGFATASALVALLVAGVAVSTWQAVRAVRAEREAKTVAAFLQDMLNSVTPEQAKGKDITLLRQMLDRTAARVDKELKSQPLTEAWLRKTLGGVYVALGDYPKAELMFRRLLELRERTLGKEHPDTLSSLHNVARLLCLKSDHAGAEPLFRRVLEARERTLGKEDLDTLRSAVGLAYSHFLKGDYAGAEPLFRRALEAQERKLGREHFDTLITVGDLASLLFLKSDYAGAEPLFRRALEARERTLGKEHQTTLSTVCELARLLDSKGDYAGAEPLFRRALAAQERTLGKEHPETLNSVFELACLLDKKGDYAGAEPLYRQAVAGYRYFADHGDAAAQFRVAEMYRLGQGVAMDEGEAIRWYRKCAEIGSAQTLNGVAWTLATSGNPKLRDGRNAVLFAEKAAVATDRKNPEYLDTLAAAYAEAGQFTTAATIQREAMALLQNDVQKNDYASRLRLYESGSPYHELGSWAGQILVMLRYGKFSQAEPRARECLAIHERQIPEDWQTFNARSLLGGSLLGQKKYAEAEPLLVSGYEGMKQREDRIRAAGRPRLKEALQRLVQLYETTGRNDQAAAWSLKLVEFEKAESAKRATALSPRQRTTVLAPRQPNTPPELLDLSSFYTADPNIGWTDGNPDNSLATLPKGSQKFGSASFDVRGLIQLACSKAPTRVFPAEVRGIKVNMLGRRIHFLHAASMSWGTGWETPIAKIVVHSRGAEPVEIPVRFGPDVRDWQFHPKQQPTGPDPATIAWKGANASGVAIQLFQTTWENPRPAAIVESLDYISTLATAAPFLVAVTIEP